MTTTIDDRMQKDALVGLRFSFGILIGSVLLTALFSWRLPAFIPLFFSRPFGAQQLAPYWVIFSLPVFLLVFYLSSLYVSKKWTNEPVLVAVYIWLSLIAMAALFISLMYVLFLVF